MDYNQLRTFVMVADEGQLTRAAEKLFTSQPAVSAQLKALEDRLNLQLFDRTPRGMLLTAAGARLLPDAREALRAASKVSQQAQVIQGQVMGTLRLGINSDYEFLRLPALLKTLQETSPGVQPALIDSMSADILSDLRKGQLDAGFFFGPANSHDLYVQLLSSIPTRVVAPSAWQAELEQADSAALARFPWIYTSPRCPFYPLTEQLLGSHAFSIHKSLMVNSEEAIRLFLREGKGISLVRLDDAEKAVSEGWGCVWPGNCPDIALSCAWLDRRSTEPLIQAWRRALEADWPESPVYSEQCAS